MDGFVVDAAVTVLLALVSYVAVLAVTVRVAARHQPPSAADTQALVQQAMRFTLAVLAIAHGPAALATLAALGHNWAGGPSG